MVRIRPTRGRRLATWALLVVMVGLLPLIGVVALAVDGGAVGPWAAAGIVAIQVALLVLAAQNLAQRWVVDDHTVSMRLPGRAARSWPREGLRHDVVSTPVDYRGIRVGTRRVLTLTTGDGVTDRLNIGLLGRGGASRLSSALRPAKGTGRSTGRRVDSTYTLDRSAIARYRRARLRWQAAGVVIVVGGVVLVTADEDFDGFWDFAGFVLAFVAAWYLVESVGRQLLTARRPAPDSIRITTDHVVVVDETSRPMGEQIAWAELVRVEMSADIDGEVVLRLCRRSGGESVYSLTAGVGEEVREEVAPWFEDLRDDLHAVLDRHDVAMVDLER